jgi:hypothetical protein
MRIGFDVDGVLADFCSAYERLIVKETGVNNFPPYAGEDRPSWNWPQVNHGYTDQQIAGVWAAIKTSPNFWAALEETTDFFRFYNWFYATRTQHDFYFVTSRPGVTAKAQTESWFIHHLLYRPTVLISSQKGAICNALNLDYYVDDNAENIESVVNLSPGTGAFLIDRTYNRHLNVGTRIPNLQRFLDTVGSCLTAPVAA